MSTRDWSPAEVAAYDQEMAVVAEEVDALIRAYRIGTAEVGPTQAVASIAKMLATRDARELSVVLTGAIQRLAGSSGGS